jgi:RNA polymerase-binding transcription factor DksA
MPLTAEQRTHLEQRLIEERARALRVLNRSIEENSEESEQDRSGDLTSLPFHVADRGTDTMQTEMEATMATRVSRELAEIDAALERLYQQPERFGVCEDTGREIPFERLDLIPWARTCEGVGLPRS